MHNICVPESYEQNSEKKVSWNIIGVIFKGKNNKTYAKLFHMPGVLLHVFEQKKKEEKEVKEVGEGF